MTIASKMTAPSNETKSDAMLKLFWLIVLIPKSGVKNRPARKAPTIPTMMLRNIPCWASVRMIMLAIQPKIPPKIIHTIKLIILLSPFVVECKKLIVTLTNDITKFVFVLPAGCFCPELAPELMLVVVLAAG